MKSNKMSDTKGGPVSVYLTKESQKYREMISDKYGHGKFSAVLNKALADFEEKHGSNIKFGL